MTPKALRATLMLIASCSLLPGCFVFVDEVEVDDDDDDRYEPPANALPEIQTNETWWSCDYSESTGDYYFEFQAVVEDWDGPMDVEYVDVTVYEAGYSYEYGAFTLNYEGDAVWGGIVWEHESDLYCGDPVDVVFDAWDVHGAHDQFTLYY